MPAPRRIDPLRAKPARLADIHFDSSAPRSVARMARSTGAVIGGKYRILRKLGEGRMGEVFHAAHVHLDQEVAIKVLRSELAGDDASLERFVREARAAARIANDHVVRVFDVGGVDEGEPYIVMEYLEGEDLASRMERGVLPVGEAVALLLQACTAIADVHQAGVIHRDLKPANLFLTRSRAGGPIVKVVDFGISKLTPRNGRAEMALTAKGITMGTPLYMAPEQLRGAVDVDPRVDVWALGVILFEMLTGRTPFEETDFLILCTRIATAPTPRLASVRPDLSFPPGLDEVLDDCLAKHPDDRCCDAGELARKLTPFLRHVTLPMIERPVTPPAATSVPGTPVTPRAEIAWTLISRRATWELPSNEPEELSPRSTMAAPATYPPSRLVIAAIAVAVPVVAFAVLGASCVSSLRSHDARTTAVVVPRALPAAVAAPPVVAREAVPNAPPPLGSAAPPPPAPPATTAPHFTPPSAHADAPNRPPPADEFGGRL